MRIIPNVGYITKHDLCTGCGICEGTCPVHAINTVVQDGNFRPIVNTYICNNEKGCHRCYDSCPGIGVQLREIARNLFDKEEIKEDPFAGKYLKCFTGYSNNYDIRYHCASGGMVSQFLIWLLENNIIDGAYVTAFDKDAPLMVRSYIATTREEILAAKSSKYAPVSLHHAIADIKNAIGSRYIIVGLPCHIEGFRKYEALDHVFKKKIAGYFSLFCSSGRSFSMTDYLFRERRIPKGELTYFAYRDEGCLGSMVAKWVENGVKIADSNPDTISNLKSYKDRFQNYYHPLRSIFVPKRCTLCVDHYGELADVSFGDIHIHPYIEDKIGVNSILVRNQAFEDLLREAQKEGAITMDEIDISTVNRSQPMVIKKKYRNAAFIRFRKMLGKAVPVYDVLPKGGNQMKWLVSFIHTSVQHYIGGHKTLWFLIPFIKGKSPQE